MGVTLFGIYSMTNKSNPENKQPIGNNLPSSMEIISKYYETKKIDTTLKLPENLRDTLGQIVDVLDSKGEDSEMIQYIVNDFKLKYGTK